MREQKSGQQISRERREDNHLRGLLAFLCGHFGYQLARAMATCPRCSAQALQSTVYTDGRPPRYQCQACTRTFDGQDKLITEPTVGEWDLLIVEDPRMSPVKPIAWVRGAHVFEALEELLEWGMPIFYFVEWEKFDKYTEADRMQAVLIRQSMVMHEYRDRQKDAAR